jgi:hypothetical protein
VAAPSSAPVPDPGEPMVAGQALSAKWLNYILKLAKAAQIKVDGASGLSQETGSGGTVIRVDVQRGFWIKLTSSGGGGKYAWTLQNETASGTFTNGTVSGTTPSDPAWELNLNASVTLSPNPIVRAWRAHQTGEVRFQSSSCT